jgi:glycosyltransferase involved in cell wall biosynthesis
MRHVVVMVTTSYPRFPGDGIGSFMEPIARSVADRGHAVHLVAPWHPAIRRDAEERGVRFHFYRYAPLPSLNVFGYSGGLRADVQLKRAAWVAAPFALAAGWRLARQVARRAGATVLHAHWVIPNGVTAALAAGGRPLVVSLHGSDMFVAEQHWAAGRAARAVFARTGWVTACSDDLRDRAIALGARQSDIETLPYGIDPARFRPDEAARAAVRAELGIGDAPFIVSAGRLVRKKGFEVLIDAAQQLRSDVPTVRLAIAGDGDLRAALDARAATLGGAVLLLGNRPQDEVARLAAAADVIAVPSVRDEAGNVDGLPNFALEGLATATPVVATRAGGLASVIEDHRTGRLVPEHDAPALADAIRSLLADPAGARALGAAGRDRVIRDFGWARVGERLEGAYDRVQVGGSRLEVRG